MALLGLAFVLGGAEKVRYDGHQLYRIIPENALQVKQLYALQNEDNLDFWLDPSTVGRPVDIRLSPESKEAVIERLQAMNLTATLRLHDIQAHFDEAYLTSGDRADWDTAYHNLDDTNKWLDDLVAKYPRIASKFSIGQTYQNRTVYGIKITGGTGTSKPQIYYDGGIHAREWIAPAVVDYIIGQLLSKYGTDQTVTKIVDSIEWFLVPIFNADGYVYTWTTDRNWRKNRQPNAGSTCVGTDPCRNADAGFGGPGSSTNPCSDTYHGGSAFSAPIVKAASQYLAGLKNLKGYINFHSYAELWLTPYGYTDAKPKDYNTQESFAKAATTAIKGVHGQTYEYGPAYTTIYPASGILSDWVYDKLGVLLSQAVELRGTSFAPAPSLIIPNGEEIFAAVLVHANSVLQL